MTDLRHGPSSTSRLTFQMAEPHRLEPRRGELDCRMMLFTSNLDPTITAYAAQHQFTHWNGEAGGDLPIVKA